MYQLENQAQWDTDYFHTLMSEKRIISSKEAKEIREKLAHAGALPHLDNNFEWAMLCIAYCFAKNLVDKPNRIIAAPNAKGTEIPSFQTCFQEFSRLWLVMLSDVLFHFNPDKAVSKDELYRLIADLWHTGAYELDQFWEGCKRFKKNDDLAARQAFLNELMDFAVKNAGSGSFSESMNDLESKMAYEHQEKRLSYAFQQQNIAIAELKFLEHGVRYDIYRLKLAKYIDLSKHMRGLCSELGVKNSSLHIVPCHNNESHTYDVKLLRDEKHWQKLGAAKFGEALENYSEDYALPICLGIDEYGKPHFADLATAPHLLVGGTTGSGKSVFIRTLLRSLFDLCKGQNKLELAILDPKKVDYQVFEHEEDLFENHIIDDYNEMYNLLIDSVEESEKRYALMRDYGVQKIAQLPENVRPPYRVIMVDELSNLIKHHTDIEKQLVMLAEKARASGIHLILSTQRPDSETLKGTLRGNLPTRIAFQVQKSTESKIILDETGAEDLLGKGDHLVKWNNGTLQFLHGFDV